MILDPASHQMKKAAAGCGIKKRKKKAPKSLPAFAVASYMSALSGYGMCGYGGMYDDEVTRPEHTQTKRPPLSTSSHHWFPRAHAGRGGGRVLRGLRPALSGGGPLPRLVLAMPIRGGRVRHLSRRVSGMHEEDAALRDGRDGRVRVLPVSLFLDVWAVWRGTAHRRPGTRPKPNQT